MALLSSVKCWFGRHDWEEHRPLCPGTKETYWHDDKHRVCRRCGQTEWAWNYYGETKWEKLGRSSADPETQVGRTKKEPPCTQCEALIAKGLRVEYDPQLLEEAKMADKMENWPQKVKDSMRLQAKTNKKLIEVLRDQARADLEKGEEDG